MASASFLNSKPFSIGVYPDTNELLKHEHGDRLVDLVNDAYHDANKPFFTSQRASDLTDLVAQIGENSFSVLVSSMPTSPTDPSVPFALGSAHPYSTMRRPLDSDSPWLVRLPESAYGDSCDRWELKVVCTDPAMKGQGVGSYVMDLLELEIKRRYRSKHAKNQASKPPLQIVLSTLHELNGAWYAGRGFKEVDRICVPKASRVGRFSTGLNYLEFNVISMIKDVPMA